MSKQNEALKSLEQLLSKIETDIKRAKLMINQINEGKSSDISDEEIQKNFEQEASSLLNYNEGEEVKVVEGVYDGYFMIGSDQKKYPVPMNYASKTKLIPGDVLKLRVMQDGKLVYKVISQANRKYIKATLSKTDDEKYTAITDEGTNYYLNQAAATYFKAKPGDELSIIINGDEEGEFAAIEAVISAE